MLNTENKQCRVSTWTVEEESITQYSVCGLDTKSMKRKQSDRRNIKNSKHSRVV